MHVFIYYTDNYLELIKHTIDDKIVKMQANLKMVRRSITNYWFKKFAYMFQ